MSKYQRAAAIRAAAEAEKIKNNKSKEEIKDIDNDLVNNKKDDNFKPELKYVDDNDSDKAAIFNRQMTLNDVIDFQKTLALSYKRKPDDIIYKIDNKNNNIIYYMNVINPTTKKLELRIIFNLKNTVIDESK